MGSAPKLSPIPTDAIGYCRVSTIDQGDSGLGLDAQRTAIEAECQRRSWHLATMQVEVASGRSRGRRESLEHALSALDAGYAQVLVVAKLDRLSRSVIDTATILERAKLRRWSLVALDLNVDTTTSSGRLVANVFASIAEWEREVIGERTSAALQQAKARGQRLGRPVTLPQQTRDRIRQEAATGRSLRAIAAALTADAIPTAQGGVGWYASTVRAVLTSVALD